MSSQQAYDTAAKMGARAGATAKETGVPAGHEPFNTAATMDLHRTWAHAYVAASCGKR